MGEIRVIPVGGIRIEMDQTEDQALMEDHRVAEEVQRVSKQNKVFCWLSFTKQVDRIVALRKNISCATLAG